MGTYSLQTDQNAEVSGIIADLGPSIGQFRLARAGGANDKYQRVLFEKLRPYRRAMQAGTFDPKTDREIVVSTFIETVLLGWEGVTDEDNNLLPYSITNAKKLFKDIPELFNQLSVVAGDAASFRIDTLEADGKN